MSFKSVNFVVIIHVSVAGSVEQTGIPGKIYFN